MAVNTLGAHPEGGLPGIGTKQGERRGAEQHTLVEFAAIHRIYSSGAPPVRAT